MRTGKLLPAPAEFRILAVTWRTRTQPSRLGPRYVARPQFCANQTEGEATRVDIRVATRWEVVSGQVAPALQSAWECPPGTGAGARAPGWGVAVGTEPAQGAGLPFGGGGLQRG